MVRLRCRLVRAREAELLQLLLRAAQGLPWAAALTARTLSPHLPFLLDNLRMLADVRGARERGALTTATDAASGAAVAGGTAACAQSSVQPLAALCTSPPAFVAGRKRRQEREELVAFAAERIRRRLGDDALAPAVCAMAAPQPPDARGRAVDAEVLLVERMLMCGADTESLLGVRHVAHVPLPPEQPDEAADCEREEEFTAQQGLEAVKG